MKNSFISEKKNREKKILKIHKKGITFPDHFKRNISIKKIYSKYGEKTRTDLEKKKVNIKIAGRIMRKRYMGKVLFLSLQDTEGEIQLYLKKNNFHSNLEIKKMNIFNIGDALGIKGKIFRTHSGELSIYCKNVIFLNKSINTLPDKFHGLTNTEECYKKPYLTFLTSIKKRKKFIERFLIINCIRQFMIKNKFIEVETPMIHSVPSGALAKPFTTYYNKLKKKMYLRIAPEIYLKKIIIGGFEKIFEINRNFRNEGISSRHNPEFTMMEMYEAYTNYKKMMKFLEKMFLHISKHVFKKTIIKYKKNIFNLQKKFKVLTMEKSIFLYNPEIKKTNLYNIKKAKKIATTLNVPYKKNWSIGNIISEIFKKTVEKKIIQPTFITQYPIDISPLSKKNKKNKKIADRFELFIAGMEIANGFSELNDPKEQKKRFKTQIKLNKKCNGMANPYYDKEYIKALEYGLPPTSGCGIGIDRLIMIFSNLKSIKETIFFPTTK